MAKKVVKLHKYYKRIIALSKNKERANEFKNLMVEAIASENDFKENSRKAKEKAAP